LKFCPPYAGGWRMLCRHFDGDSSRFCEGGSDRNVCSWRSLAATTPSASKSASPAPAAPPRPSASKRRRTAWATACRRATTLVRLAL